MNGKIKVDTEKPDNKGMKIKNFWLILNKNRIKRAK
jgi:hypothetical protein